MDIDEIYRDHSEAAENGSLDGSGEEKEKKTQDLDQEAM